MNGRETDTFAIADAKEAFTEEADLFGLRVRSRGSAGAAVALGGRIRLSNIGSSGEDGARIPIPRGKAVNVRLGTRGWSDLPSRAYLRKALVAEGEELAGTRRTIARTRRKAHQAGTNLRTVFTDDFPSDVIGSSGNVTYEARLGGAVVQSVTTSPAPVVVAALGVARERAADAQGASDPLDGLDVSLIDKTTNSPVVVGTDWPQSFEVTLPGLGAVEADGYRAFVDGTGLIPDAFVEVEITGRDLDEVTIDDAVVAFEGCACDSTWAKQPIAGPSPRRSHALAYDSDRSVTVLFGGRDEFDAFLGDTWEWDGSSWQEITTAGAPSPRSGSGIVYDSGRQVVVLYGGRDGTGRLDDTWEWDGSDWTNTLTGDQPRSDLGIAYDDARGVVVRYGGNSGSGRGSKTWEYAGASWVEVASGDPGSRSGHAMAYDPNLGACVMYGGTTGATQNDTWLWDGVSWTPTTSGPGARQNHVLATDPGCGDVFLFGGTLGSGLPTNEFWKFAAGTWVPAAGSGPTPEPRLAPGAVYEAHVAQLLVFGGRGEKDVEYGDTWSFGCQPIVVGVGPTAPAPPVAAHVFAAPNPFRAWTVLHYSLPEGGRVQLGLFDARGRLVGKLVDRVKAPGSHAVRWDGRDGTGHGVAPGVYFYRLHTPRETRSGKILRIQ